MSKDVTFDLDTREWDRALVEYASVSSKDWPTICNSKARDLLFKAAKNTPKAKPSEIQRLKQEPWFIPWIAKQVVREHGKGTLTKKRFRVEARKLANKIIRSRKQSVGYMRSGFVKAANKLPVPDPKRPKKARKVSKGKNFPQVKTHVVLATVRRALSSFDISWKASSDHDATLKDRVITKAIQSGMRDAENDMRKYIDRKMQTRAKKHSAK